MRMWVRTHKGEHAQGLLYLVPISFVALLGRPSKTRVCHVIAFFSLAIALFVSVRSKWAVRVPTALFVGSIDLVTR